jgi:hypothetical protein
MAKQKLKIQWSAPYNSSDTDRDPFTSQLRQEFFVAIKNVAPEMLVSLRDAVLPEFREYLKQFTQHDRNSSEIWHVNHQFLEKKWTRLTSKQLPIPDPLKTWCKNLNLDYDWFYDRCLSTLKMWDLDAVDEEGDAWGAKNLDLPPIVTPLGGFSTLNEERDLHQELLESLNVRNLWFNSHLESADEWLERVKKAVGNFKPIVEVRLGEKGIERPPSVTYRDLEWLARWLLKGETDQQIADSYTKIFKRPVKRKQKKDVDKIDGDSIGSARRAVAKRLGIKLPRRGRPKKSDF